MNGMKVIAQSALHVHGTSEPSRQTLMPCCVQQASLTSWTQLCRLSSPPRPVPASQDSAPRTRARLCWHGETNAWIACTSKPSDDVPMNCIKTEHRSQNGTSSSAHSGEHRAGMPSEQSPGADVEPQQIGRMSARKRGVRESGRGGQGERHREPPEPPEPNRLGRKTFLRTVDLVDLAEGARFLRGGRGEGAEEGEGEGERGAGGAPHLLSGGV